MTIEITHLQKVVGEQTVVDVDNLLVREREVAAIVGAAGSGKAALLSLLTGQQRPTAGTIKVAGLELPQPPGVLSEQIGVLFAWNALYGHLSVRANLHFICELRNLPFARVEEVIAQVGLADHAHVPADKLAGGLARRVALGRAILHRPAVLLLMEPLAGCDAASAAFILRLVRQLAEEGASVLMLALDGARLTPICQTVHDLEHGRIVRSTAPQEARPDAALPFKIPAQGDEKVVLLNPADILYAVSEAGRTLLCTAAGRVPTHFTLTDLEQRLSRSGFFRAHRSYLVNLQQVKEVVSYTRDSFTLILDDTARTEIPLSKGSARELRELLGY